MVDQTGLEDESTPYLNLSNSSVLVVRPRRLSSECVGRMCYNGGFFLLLTLLTLGLLASLIASVFNLSAVSGPKPLAVVVYLFLCHLLAALEPTPSLFCSSLARHLPLDFAIVPMLEW